MVLALVGYAQTAITLIAHMKSIPCLAGSTVRVITAPHAIPTLRPTRFGLAMQKVLVQRAG